MIKNLTRGFSALTLALIPLLAPAPPAQAAEVATLADAVGRLPIAPESREGYQRTSFKHWNTGLDPADGCHTRNEVLLAEAIERPDVAPGCRITGGRWLSYYDGQFVTDAGSLDIDHMVPLAEAWDSGASAWTPARREAYANDQHAETSLVAVTARTNRSKADQDPAQWLPPAAESHCRYLTEWVATKLRWQLAADTDEIEALKLFADGPCEDAAVIYTPAP
ncbi:HNH endonuclease family protein [Streptomyces sp. AM8-1-1]|uniref:HNH endonuclease family protein n=1 Tax=Streptomyces sp. AM8-1-1 TaxID=3075825 RepID=UPI0028C465A7|nr:HNH endonuclease family protein [Streptomyces sp. AM8-1-1]WNO70144.1 HNH endonuclease family protein [Streptomyces sp. AM8-1-1]WNO76972.1 HNH endonuclease family protein [Streptomyces sp. AM8-1-1]